jgi:starch-binding outer membrane protein, SusD/RagB family
MKYISPIIFLLVLNSCKKFVEVKPPIDRLTSEKVFESEAAANSAVLGIYSQMLYPEPYLTCGAMTIYTGLYADELVTSNSFSASETQFADNSVKANNSIIYFNVWQKAFKYIYQSNACIEGLANSTKVPANARDQLIGEVLFIRSFIYFYLTNLFGEVPLVLKTDFKDNARLPRIAQSKIYDQIKKDLIQAAALMGEDYVAGGHSRPNRFAAISLLARVYLYTGDWKSAALAAGQVINSGHYTLLDDLTQVFLFNSPEAIWQLYPVGGYFNTTEGIYFVPFASTVIPSYFLTDTIVHSFDSADRRLSAWTGINEIATKKYFYPYKYKVGYTGDIIESYVMLRYAELFLIRAEANAQLDLLQDAVADINIIRERAGVFPVNLNTKSQVLLILQQERLHELFAEWGHRWFDLRRTGKANEILTSQKPGWSANDTLFPIPQSEILLNPALTQNPGF